MCKYEFEISIKTQEHFRNENIYSETAAKAWLTVFANNLHDAINITNITLVKVTPE